MADKRIVNLDIDNAPDGVNDFIAIDRVGGTTRRTRPSDIVNNLHIVTSVNGVQGPTVTIDADDIDDTLTDHKFISDADSIKLGLLRTDQGADTFLSGDGIYRSPQVLDATNIGTGAEVLNGLISSTLEFKTLKPSTYISYDETSDEITLNDSAMVSFIAQSIYEASTSGNNGVYNGASPSTVTVGGLPAGTALSGRSYDSLFEEILVEYLLPAFTSFSITGQSTLIEVGTVLSGSKTFTWATSNSGNVASNSVAIRDVTANTLLASSLANDGSESVAIGTIDTTSPGTQSYRAEATNTQANSFTSSNFNVARIYPFFYGVVSGSRPTSDQTLIDNGTKSVTNSSGTISVTYNSTSSDYIWFAIPSTSTSKTVWYVNALNNGSIGGSVDPGGNLFPTFDTVSVDSPTSLWSGVNYKFYVSNYPSAVNTIEFRNS